VSTLLVLAGVDTDAVVGMIALFKQLTIHTACMSSQGYTAYTMPYSKL